jgi:hypothetical protein
MLSAAFDLGLQYLRLRALLLKMRELNADMP